MSEQVTITDHGRFQFMQKLQLLERTDRGPMLTDWEKSFLASFAIAPRQTLWFTPGRQDATDLMWKRYGADKDVDFPFPSDLVKERPAIADADPTGCQFIVRDEERRQRRCNEPATCRESRQGGQSGLRYCDSHADQVKKAVKNIALIKL